MQSARLIQLAAGHAVENMSIDQALLEITGNTRVPTLRLYTWCEPTLSLGYFQKRGDRQTHQDSLSIDAVRRSTGGGAIVHHHELTYSLFLPIEPTSGSQRRLYSQVHKVIAAALKAFGVTAVPFRMLGQSTSDSPNDPFLCFQRRTDEDLIVSGYKILGSAQRKSRGAVLQHGSLLLRSSPWSPQLPGIGELTGHFIPVAEIADRVSKGIAKRMGWDWEPHPISTEERKHAERISESKFGSPQWYERR
ncbi:MAG: biotin/lipoate A/B protein ligase family protein [Planctomycetota bacterium]